MKRFLNLFASAALSFGALGAAGTEDELEWLNIAPMLPEHRDEITADIRRMAEQNCITRNAFILTLVPEGDPPVDKARILGERFSDFRKALGETDMPVGILIQATIGHGWAPNSRSKFQQIVFPDGTEPYQFCPLDEGFRAYVRDVIRRLAALRPDFMMVDDDFRLLTGRNGCFCPLHLARFNAAQGTNYTRESLRTALQSDPKLAAAYDELLKNSLVELARQIRQAIDETDPAIPCSFCACSGDVRHAPAVAEALAAPGQPWTIRINNARYLTESLRNFPEWLLFSARQIAAMPEHCKILAEPDTFPHNRYSTSVTMVHAVLTHSILEGCRGGKLWLSRTGTFEPQSGLLYRKCLSDNAGFYRELARLPILWNGAATVLPQNPTMNFPAETVKDSNVTWSTQVLGKMGIPFYFTKNPSGLVTLAGQDCDALSDAQLSELLNRHQCLLDGTAAIAATRRGFGKMLGVEALPWDNKAVTFEQTADGGIIPVSADLPTAGLIPAADTEILSTLYHRPSGVSPEAEKLSPGVTYHQNPDGGQVVVVAVPIVPFGHVSFAMLNETRKAQLLDIFRRFNALQWYVPGDDEVMLKTGRTTDGDIAILTNLSLDVIDPVVLAGPGEKLRAVEELCPDGQWRAVEFELQDGHAIQLQRSLPSLRPLVLKLRY